MMIELSLDEILAITQGFVSESYQKKWQGKPFTGLNTLSDASSSEISFLANAKYKADLATTDAGLVLVSKALYEAEQGEQKDWLAAEDAYLAFAQIQRKFYPSASGTGIRHPSAVIADDAMIADDVDIAANTVLGAGSQVGEGSIIQAGVVIGKDVRIGEHCYLHPNVVVADGCVLHNRVILQAGVVVGSDGFGYAWTGQEHCKIPQVGKVILEDDVELGANTCIDRGALGDTIIRQGVKLDNLIQIGHNVELGAMCIMASQVGISGSTTFGKGCQVGGQAGVAGHVHVGDGVQIAAKTGVMSDLQSGGVYAGMPAMPHRTWLKVSALIQRLPEIWKKIR